MNTRSLGSRCRAAALAAVLVLAAVANASANSGAHGGGGFHGGGGLHGGSAHAFGGHYGGGNGRGYYGRGYYGRGYYGRGYYGRGYYGGRWGWGWGLGAIGLGWYLASLPWDYATYWVNGVPYYYANSAYYVWDPNANEYQAVAPPAGLPANAPTGTTVGPNGLSTPSMLFAYPKAGQTPEQQTRDRSECHAWAAGQAGFDPATSSSGEASQGATSAKRQDYLRAEAACLEARNYSVQ